MELEEREAMTTEAKKYANRYPWRKWFAKKEFTLKRGRDFDVLVHGMVGMIRNAARSKTHRLRVSCFVGVDGTIRVRVLGRRNNAVV